MVFQLIMLCSKKKERKKGKVKTDGGRERNAAG